MKKQGFLAAAACCLLLCGCGSLLEREYTTVEEHSSKYWESESAGTLRAETYQDIVNDLMLLVGQHTESGILRLYNYEDDTSVSDALEQAATEVKQETPLGAYAVKYITSEWKNQRSYYEVSLRISYRRTTEQVRSVVNATSTAALPDLLDAALESGRTELAVRVGYWGDGEVDRVAQIVAQVRESRALTETPPWKVFFYPNSGPAGLVEFVMDTGETSLEEAVLESAVGESPAEGAASADAAARP